MELKDGMIVELRNDWIFMKLGNYLVNNSVYLCVSDYSKETLKSSEGYQYDIVKVYTVTGVTFTLNDIFDKDNLDCIWKEKVRFNKSDLKNGMIIQYRNGKKRIVIDNCLCGIGDGDDGHMTNFKDYYDDVLRYDGSSGSTLDIVRVYDRNNCNLCECGELLWEEE